MAGSSVLCASRWTSLVVCGADDAAGGVVWCDAAVWRRSALSDRLVKALVKIKCPSAIQSHQIQGLDYEKLFPVLQWLVRKVIETRRMTGDTVRQLSLAQFGKSYQLPSDSVRAASRDYAESVLAAYAPKRRFRKKETAAFDTPVRSRPPPPPPLLLLLPSVLRARTLPSDAHAPRDGSLPPPPPLPNRTTFYMAYARLLCRTVGGGCRRRGRRRRCWSTARRWPPPPPRPPPKMTRPPHRPVRHARCREGAHVCVSLMMLVCRTHRSLSGGGSSATRTGDKKEQKTGGAAFANKRNAIAAQFETVRSPSPRSSFLLRLHEWCLVPTAASVDDVLLCPLLCAAGVLSRLAARTAAPRARRRPRPRAPSCRRRRRSGWRACRRS